MLMKQLSLPPLETTPTLGHMATPTFKPQLSACNGSVTNVPAKVADGAPATVHVDLDAPVGRGRPVDQSDGYGEVALSADHARILPVDTVVVAPGVGTTVTQEALGTIAGHIVQPDTLSSVSYRE